MVFNLELSSQLILLVGVFLLVESNDLLREEEIFSSSLSDDSASELSLTDVSSDELSSATEIKEPEGKRSMAGLGALDTLRI